MKIYVLRDIDTGEIMLGNKTALYEYAQDINNDLIDHNEEYININNFNDVLKVIESKRIIISEFDTKDLNTMEFNVFDDKL